MDYQKHSKYGNDDTSHNGNCFSNYNLKSRIKTVQEDAIISLAEMVEFRGKQNKVHLYSVSAVTKVICKALGLSEEETRIISMAAIAHDIGKIAIPMIY